MIERIAAALSMFNSLEFTQSGIPCYYLHVTFENGNISFSGNCESADVTFISELHYRADTLEKYYDNETLKSDSFYDVCKDLERQINEYLIE